MKWFTSDQHFGHKNVIQYESRPFQDVGEMNEKIIENWNSVVQPNDEVHVLGDMAFHKACMLKDIVPRLKGKIHLILGNHDSIKSEERNFFESIKMYDLFRYNKQKFVLFHYPIHSWDGMLRGSIHLHGHVHKGGIENMEHEYKRLNVGVGFHDYKPISIDSVIEHFKSWKFPDQKR